MYIYDENGENNETTNLSKYSLNYLEDNRRPKRWEALYNLVKINNFQKMIFLEQENHSNERTSSQGIEKTRSGSRMHF